MLKEPDFTTTVFPTIEEKLGRKLSEEENKRFYFLGGMRKEWFYNELERSSPARAEKLLATCHLSVGSTHSNFLISILKFLLLDILFFNV